MFLIVGTWFRSGLHRISFFLYLISLNSLTFCKSFIRIIYIMLSRVRRWNRPCKTIRTRWTSRMRTSLFLKLADFPWSSSFWLPILCSLGWEDREDRVQEPDGRHDVRVGRGEEGLVSPHWGWLHGRLPAQLRIHKVIYIFFIPPLFRYNEMIFPWKNHIFAQTSVLGGGKTEKYAPLIKVIHTNVCRRNIKIIPDPHKVAW